jgi:hypothetical protein
MPLHGVKDAQSASRHPGLVFLHNQAKQLPNCERSRDHLHAHALGICLIRCHFRQAADHQVDYGHPNHGFTGFRPQLGLFAQAPVPIERPGGAFHYPALRMTAKPLPVSERSVISSRIGRCGRSALTQFISGLA